MSKQAMNQLLRSLEDLGYITRSDEVALERERNLLIPKALATVVRR